MKKQVAISSTLTLLLLLCLFLTGCGSRSSGLPPQELAKTPVKVSGGLPPGTPGTGMVRFTVTVPEGPSAYPNLKPGTREIPAGTEEIKVYIYGKDVEYKEVVGYFDWFEFEVKPGTNTIDCSMVVPVGEGYDILVLASDDDYTLTIGRATGVKIGSGENKISITLERLKIKNLTVQPEGANLTATFDMTCPIDLDESCYLRNVEVLLVSKNDNLDETCLCSSQSINDLPANTSRRLNLTLEGPPLSGEEEKVYVCPLLQFFIGFKTSEYTSTGCNVTYVKQDQSPLFEVTLKGDGTWGNLNIEVN